MGTRPVAPVDSLWLHMDTPENLMVIEGVMLFDEPMDHERAARVLQLRLTDRYPVFTQIPVHSRNPLGGVTWVDFPDFDITDHVVHHALPPPGDDTALQDYVAAQMSRPITRSNPLWEAHFIDGYGTGSALLVRFHHALADGTALARVLLEMTDDDPAGDLAEAAAIASGSVPNAGPSYSLPGVPQVVADSVGTVGRTVSDALKGGLHAMSRLPGLLDPQRVADAAHLVTSTGATAQKLLFTTQPDSILKGRAGVPKVASWSRAHDLPEIKAASQRLGVTINDLVVAALAGALHRHVVAHGGVPEDLTTMVPVNLRPLDRPLPRELGNKFALVMLNLPIGAATAGERLALTKRRMDEIKSSPEPVLTFGIIESLGTVSPTLARNMIDFFSAKAIGVTTNVPGPRQARYFAGIPVRGVLGWAPSAGDQSINACIFSFNDQLRVGFKADEDIVPDPHGLVAEFDAALAELMALPD